MTDLVIAGETFEVEAAKAVIAGYCFAEVEADIHPPSGETYGPQVEPWRRRCWGYLSYDCQRGSGPKPDVVDVMAPVLLNVSQGYGVRLVSDLLAIAPAVREVVAPVTATDFCFWDLDPNDVVPTTPRPPDGSSSLSLHRAWYLVESVKGADVAVTHKLLHHAWPHLFPLIDNRTIDALGRDRAWVTMLEDLQRHEEVFVALEDWFAELARDRGGVPLTRLRLYDILLWCRVVDGEEEEATRLGRAILSESPQIR